MTLLRSLTTDEYWAEYSVLVIRDHDGEADYTDRELLAEFATDAQPGGTIATAGAGWLWASASSGDGDNEVRLEVHDDVPADDLGDWGDVVETPYLSFSGTVALGLLTGSGDKGDKDDAFRLGSPGHYRARVSGRRPPDETDGDRWRVQFWPTPGDPRPPRWLARAPVVIESPTWVDPVLDPHVSSVLRSARELVDEHPEGASAAQIAADRVAKESAYADQAAPDSPLWPPDPRPPLTTGHPDLDAVHAQARARMIADWARRRATVAELAARVGMPAPVTVGDVLPLLVGMGLLARVEDRYRPPGLPSVRDARAGFRYPTTSEAADLVAVGLWTPTGPAGTVADLAGRLLMPPDQVRAALRYAQQQRLLHVGGDPDDDTSPLVLTPLPRRGEPAGEPLPVPPPVAGRPVREPRPGAAPRGRATAVTVGRGSPSPSAEGAPPVAGIVTRSGDLITWRGGSAQVLARVSDDVFRAIETPYGISVLSDGGSVLVRPDGRAEALATGTGNRTARISADGRYLALAQARFGRRPRFELHVIDLADGSRQTLRWSAYVSVLGVHGNAVFFGTADAGSFRWTPGTDPVPLPVNPRTVDRISGRFLVDGSDEDVDGWLVIDPDGERHNVLATGAAELALGGALMLFFRYTPPAVTLFDVATGGADPRVVWLPEGTDTQGRAWEDAGHILFTSKRLPALRLDVRTGEVQRVPLPGVRETHVVFVESLKDPDSG